MEQYREGQYDDDLTVGIDEYDDDIDTGAVDLFEYVGEDDSPLARLKSIILSIDWEITDDILRQFNEELLDLKDIWAGNKVNLIYVQALEKLSRYIYKEKADAHPNTIKLLLTFYANLEKIVSSTFLSEVEKKNLLMEDVQRFEKLKKQIGRIPESEPVQPVTEEAENQVEDLITQPVQTDLAIESDAEESPLAFESVTADDSQPLLNLKAIVYGIDWEITERDLANLSKEVNVLEKKYQSSKAKMIFLQGIGSLGAYINLKRSDAHADAFKLLHSFFIGLEKVVVNDLPGLQEKNILMPEVQKFNEFKAAIADTISPDAIARESARIKKSGPIAEPLEEDIQPAFSDMPEDVHGFREDEELAAIGEKEDEFIADKGAFELEEDEFFEKPEKSESALASEMESRLSGMFDGPGKEEMGKLEASVALQGVDVESDADDDSEEEPLPEEGGELVPALANEQDAIPAEDSPAVFTDQLDEFFTEPETEDTAMIGTALPGVDVETDADDDSDEDPLPFEDGEFAPALSSEDDDDFRAVENDIDETPDDVDQRLDHFFSDSADKVDVKEEGLATGEQLDDVISQASDEGEETELTEEQSATEIDNRFDDFFGTDDAAPSFEHAKTPLDGVNVESEADEDFDEEPLQSVDGELIPALSVGDEGLADTEDQDSEDTAADVEGRFDDIFNEDEVAGKDEAIAEDDSIAVQTDSDSVEDKVADVSTTPFGSVDAEQALLGVDAETDDDDESDEESLLYENDELAPALSVEDEEDSDRDGVVIASEDDSESIVADQFDAFFGTDDEEEAREDSEGTLAESVQLDEIRSEPDPADITPFDEAGFEEVLDDDIANIPIDVQEQDEEEVVLEPGETPAYEESMEERLDDLFQLDGDAISPGSSPDLDLDEGQLPSELLDYSEDQLFEEIAEMDDVEEIPAEDVVALLDENEAKSIAIDTDISDDSNYLLDEFDRIAGEDESQLITHPDDNEDYIVAVEGTGSATDQEEEVVFEPVIEDQGTDLDFSDQVDGDVDSTKIHSDKLSEYDDLDTFGTVLLTEEPTNKEGRFHDIENDSALEGVSGDLDEEGIVGSLGQLPEGESDNQAYIEQTDVVATQDNLSDLRNCIISLGLEIDDVILGSLSTEIERLRHAWMTKPLEKSYLQLLSSIALHVEKFRYEADPDANKLLLSVFDKLEITCLKEKDASQLQEVLFAETSKVLQWQQKLIDRKPTARGEIQDRIDETSEDHLQDKREPEEAPKVVLDETGDDKKVSSELGDIAQQVENGLDKDELISKVSSMMKNELDQLKDTFRLEIQELKNELKQDSKRE